MLEIIEETIVDSIKLLPFLFITYLIMEYIEHKTSKKAKETIKKAGKFGPVLGALLGVVPQCGFSAAAANLYAGRIITLGTLIAIFLSTSDEMLPVLISEAAPVDIILKILGIKLILGMVSGIIIDVVYSLIKKGKIENEKIKDLCEHEHCHCEQESIWKSALKHTINIFLFILIISFVINILIFFIGRENISNVILNKPIIGPILAGIVGLIPNCASSVILTKLYLTNVISVSTMLAGLLVGSGVGILVLCKQNRNLKENIKIILLLYIIGVVLGILLENIGFIV